MAFAGVYPRMYGETAEELKITGGPTGLSPHVRGNRTHDHAAATAFGSIPACTGKPVASAAEKLQVAVYPRMYGETIMAATRNSIVEGLSPHVRGNQDRSRSEGREEGSIPACTGKPLTSTRSLAGTWVYPRMYGETPNAPSTQGPMKGLSPHVRGNPVDTLLSLSDHGSIPACTGKPKTSTSTRTSHQVYPRMYGETSVQPRAASCLDGLSPRVRGNRNQHGSWRA